MTDRQLRALGRKHLLIMIRDLEQNLAQAMAEREALMQAFQFGLAQNQGFQGQPYLDTGGGGWLPAAQQPYAAQEARNEWAYAQQQAAWYPAPMAH